MVDKKELRIKALDALKEMMLEEEEIIEFDYEISPSWSAVLVFVKVKKELSDEDMFVIEFRIGSGIVAINSEWEDTMRVEVSRIE